MKYGTALAALVVMVCAAAPAAAAAGSSPTPTQRAAGTLATRDILHRADLGRGWSQEAGPPSQVPPLSCGGVVPSASAATPTWSDQATGTYASGTAYAWGAVAQAARGWARTATAAMRSCLARQFAQGSTSGVRLRASSVRRLPAPAAVAGIGSRLYVIAGTASGAGQQTDVSAEVLLQSRGRGVVEDELLVAGGRVGSGLAGRIARAQARHFGA